MINSTMFINKELQAKWNSHPNQQNFERSGEADYRLSKVKTLKHLSVL